MDKKLEDFTKLGGAIAVNLGLLTEQQQQTLAYLQAMFGELYIKTGKDFKAVPFPKNEQQIQSLITEHQLDKAAIREAADKLGPTSNAPQGAPRYFDAAEMAGFLPKPRSNAILAAQSGARMANLAEQLRTGDFGEKPPTLAAVLEPKTHGFIDEGAKKNPPEPAYLTAAQSTEHLAKIFSAALIEKNDSELLKDTDVRRAVLAFQLYASQTLKRAGNEMDATGMLDAGKTIRESRESLHGFSRVNPLSELANTRALVNDMQRGFAKLGLSDEVMQLVNKRLEQSRGMQHKGIAIDPITRGTAKIDVNSWLSKVQTSRNQGGRTI
jgi:hypothetical protein